MASNFNNLPQMSEELHNTLSEIVGRTAASMEAMAAVNAPVDTGFLKGSIYSTSVAQGSTYGQNAITPPTKYSYLLPEEVPDDDMTAIIGVAANYGIFLELGTRYQPAQPYLLPAMFRAQDMFETAIESALSRLGEGLKADVSGYKWK